MTGPEHYGAAQKLLSEASFYDSDGLPVTRRGVRVDPLAHASLLLRAHIHATLAHTAATAQANRQNHDGPPGMDIEDQGAWDAVTRSREAR